MRASRGSRHGLVVACALAALAFVVWGCNAILGIDEQGARPPPADTSAPDVVEEPPVRTGPCVVDSDCTPPNGCYTPHCDTTNGTCFYGVCEIAGRACAAGTCNVQTKQCEGATDYSFRTTSYPLPFIVGCSRDASHCVAAAWPFLFVGTKDGVTALVVDDPIAKGPRTIAVTGFTGVPSQIRVSAPVQGGKARRVWIVGTPVSLGNAMFSLSIGMFDVPENPTVQSIAAKTTQLTYPFSVVTAYASPNDTLYLGVDAPGWRFPATTITLPLEADGGDIALAAGLPIDADGGVSPGGGSRTTHILEPIANVPPGGGYYAGVSGDRLVVYVPPSYALVLLPGTKGASAVPITPSFALNASGASFSSGPSGALLLAASHNTAVAGVDCNCPSVSRVRWILDRASSTTISESEALDLEKYSNPMNTACGDCGPYLPQARAAWIDDKTALVVASSGEAPGVSRAWASVRLVSREPLAIVPDRHVTFGPPNNPTGNFGAPDQQIALNADRGIGYLLLADPTTTRSSLSIFDPRCTSPAVDAGK